MRHHVPHSFSLPLSPSLSLSLPLSSSLFLYRQSPDRGLLRVPFARTSTRQKRAFAVAGPSIWNGLPLSIRSLPRTLPQTFLSQLKAVLFGRVGVGIASE